MMVKATRQSAMPKKRAGRAQQAAARSRASWLVPLAIGLGLFAATFAAHFPATRAGYIWDDNLSLYDNPSVISPHGLYRSWFTTHNIDYWPLTTSMYWLEWRIWGNNPTPFHVANIVLHALAAIALWRVLLRLGLGDLGAFLSGLLFALHPVTVESVAWIAERKNVLSMLLYLLAIIAYLRFEANNRWSWYVAAWFTALAALLAKTSVVALPVILLLLGWWRRGTLSKQCLLRTAPFFLISLILGIVTIWFQHKHAIADMEVRSEDSWSRIAAVGWVTWFYLYKLIAPFNLCMVYPRWNINGQQLTSYIPLALLILCGMVLWRFRNTWARGPLVALSSFVIVLAPVLGLLNMSYAQYSLVADHLQYPGIPGIMALIGGSMAGLVTYIRQKGGRAGLAVVAVLYTAIYLSLAGMTWRQATIYFDRETMWNDTLDKNPEAWMAHNNLASDLLNKGRIDEAIGHLDTALMLNPDFTGALYNRGNALGKQGAFRQAIKDYTRAIELRPNYSEAYNNRGTVYGTIGDFERELQDYSRAIELNPYNAEALCNHGMASKRKGDYAAVIQDFSRAIDIKPNLAEAYLHRGDAYLRIGDFAQAVQDCSRAIDIKPWLTEAYNTRAAAYCSLGDYDKAWADVNICRQMGGTVNSHVLGELAKASERTE